MPGIDPESPRYPQFLALADPDNPWGTTPVEFCWPRKDGTDVWMEQTKTVIRDGAGRATDMVFISRDISRRKATQQALRESEERFATACNVSPAGISISRLSDGRFVEANPAFLEDKGYTRDEVIGRTSSELGLWTDATYPDRVARQMREHGSFQAEAVPYRTKSGETRIGYLSGRISTLNGEPHVMMHALDITKLQETEQQLRLLSSITEQISDATVVADASLKITYMNKTDMDLLGYTLEEAAGQPFSLFNEKKLPRRTAERMRRLLHQGKPWRGVIRKRRKDGSPSDYPVSWDVDTRIFKITSTADDTYIQAYSSKVELRQMGDAMTGEYVAIGNSLMLDNYYPYDKRDTLLTDSTTSITSVPADGDALEAYLYWTGWLDDSRIITVLNDTGDDITTNWNRATPSDWSQGSGEYVGENTGGSADADYLTLDTLDLSSYTPGSVLISWDQSSAASELYHDTADNLDGWTASDSAWSASGGEFVGHNAGAASYLTMNAPFDLSSAPSGTVSITWDQDESGGLESADYLYYAFSSDNGSSWSSNSVAFHGNNPSSPKTVTVPDAYLTSQFELRFQLSGFNGGDEYCQLDNIKIERNLSSSDGLDFAVSGDNGANWSDPIEAFRDDVTGSTDSYEYYLPSAYTTGQFMLRFDTVGLTNGQSVSVDNFLVRDLPPDTDVTFEIDGEQVHFDGNGDPHAGSDPVEADSSAVLLAPTSLGGYFYRSKTDVSRLVKTYPVDEGEEHHTGNAAYTVGDVDGSTGNYLSHCGWSMILIYASPTTAGHYLYLRDFFADNPGSTNLDFDKDGVAGGDITNFVVPEPIRNKQGDIIESVAARITCFVGEGDANYTGDSLEITGQQSGSSLFLSNSASPYNNVWNGASPDMSYPGIDVDTFEVDWDDGILQPGDTTLHLDMDSGTDAWTFIYLIMSVRSETLTSGTTHYLINRN